jgi:O-antigen/teichoic acid export membrane protein
MMPKRHTTLPALVWQMLLMGLLGLSGIIFVPLLMRTADVQLMANVLVAQVCVYYLLLLVQFGSVISGPAAMARAADAAGKAQVWHQVLHSKWLLAMPVTLLFGWTFVSFAWGQWYLLWSALLVVAFAVNSNWFLQAHQNFASGTAFAALGVGLSVCMLWMLPPDGVWLVLILAMPQVSLGFGTWLVARRVCTGLKHTKPSWQGALGLLLKDAPLVASQLLLLAATTLGTVVVGSLAESQTTAAYAATEKLFNLGATVMVGLYMVLYPRFADWFYQDRTVYWVKTKQLFLVSLIGGGLLAVLLHLAGAELMALYLPDSMASIVAPVLGPFAVWLGLCLSQHVLTSYLVLAERQRLVLWANAWVMAVTVGVGFAFAQSSPIDWVYGMLAGQAVALAWLYRLYARDQVLRS